MASNAPTNPPPEDRARGYEIGDVNPIRALVAISIFIGFAAVAHLWLYRLWVDDADSTRGVDQPRSILREPLSANALPPLQPTQRHDRLPADDLRTLRRREDTVFSALGWKVPPDAGPARPPDALLRLVEQRRQRSATQPATQPATEATP